MSYENLPPGVPVWHYRDGILDVAFDDLSKGRIRAKPSEFEIRITNMRGERHVYYGDQKVRIAPTALKDLQTRS